MNQTQQAIDIIQQYIKGVRLRVIAENNNKSISEVFHIIKTARKKGINIPLRQPRDKKAFDWDQIKQVCERSGK